MSRDPSATRTVHSKSAPDNPKGSPVLRAIDTLSVDLATSNGLTIDAEIDVVPRFASCFEDLQINVGRFGPSGAVRILTRFFGVNDPEGKAFASSLVGSLNWTLTEDDVKPDTCVFKAGEFGYRLVVMMEDPKQDVFEMFAKEAATLGFVEMEDDAYVSVRLGETLTAIARVNARSSCDSAGTLPPLDRAHGNGVMLEMRSFTDHQMAAVRFVRLPQRFLSKLKSHLAVQAERGAQSMPTASITGVFVGDEHRLAGATEAVGEDCRVFGAYVPAESLGMKW
jgi:hypothetical protein